MQGKTVSGYTLEHQLGMGGMAEVWYAKNKIQKPVAVKFLLPKFCADAEIVERFEREVEVMVKLDHPNIRQVLDSGEFEGRPYIVMEYLEGDDLKTRMQRGERFSEQQLEKWWTQLADALNYTHAQGIVHRDIKPSNIFVNQRGDVKILDFGIAKVSEGVSGTRTGQQMGTLLYMSPEQIRDSKHIDGKSDIYSLAVTFVHLLSGTAPYDSTTTDDYTIRKNIVEVPLDMTGVPAAWQDFLQPYLAKEPARRPALVPFAATTLGAGCPTGEETFVGTSSPRPVTPAEPEKAKKRRTGLWITLILLLAIGASVGIYLQGYKHNKKADKKMIEEPAAREQVMGENGCENNVCESNEWESNGESNEWENNAVISESNEWEKSNECDTMCVYGQLHSY